MPLSAKYSRSRYVTVSLRAETMVKFKAHFTAKDKKTCTAAPTDFPAVVLEFGSIYPSIISFLRAKYHLD